ncbi:MAG: polyisoprenoid-binding protein YceI [Flavobacteriaceae bacterium]|jgi:polyisoprenoid-binding protein YceI
MKKSQFILFAAIGLFVTSCSSVDADVLDQEAEAMTYTLDAAKSSLGWKGSAPDHFQEGTISFSEGSVTMEGEALTAGSFTVDMSSILPTSLEPEKADYLAAHLMGTMPDEQHPVNMFFNTPEFPDVTVTLGDFKDGNLEVTLDIIGSKLTQNVAVKIASDENGASIKGSFSLDFKSLDMPGFGVDENGNGISPVLEFDLDVALTK